MLIFQTLAKIEDFFHIFLIFSILSSFSDKSFKRSGHLRIHVKSKHEEKSEYEKNQVKKPEEKTECPICKAIFGKTNLRKHLKTVHEGIKDFKCDHCGKEYTENKGLKVHIKRHHDNVRDEQCNQCGKQFFTKEVLKEHVRNIHNKDQNQKVHHKQMAKLLKCEFCGKAFTTKNSLQIHIKAVHKGSRDHVCHICKYITYYLLA